MTRLEMRLQLLERSRRRTPKDVTEMTDAELEAIIGITNPTSEQLQAIIEEEGCGNLSKTD